MPSAAYAFGEFVLDLSERRLSRGQHTVSLPPKAFDVLAALVGRAGHLLTKDDLLQLVWAGSFVEEGILTVHVATLRKALGDGARSFIETVPGSGYRFVAPVIVKAHSHAGTTGFQPQASIAVLPFSNLSGLADDAYFSDGLTEEIIDRLASIPGVLVMARTSAFALRGQALDVRQIADKLGVGAVLEGSVRKAGNRIRVTARLVNAADGCQLWSQRYDRQLIDVFTVQDEIAVALAAALKLRLISGGVPSLSRPANFGAYEAYLKGLHQRRAHTAESMLSSLGWFARAIELEPGYAGAHAGAAGCYVSLATEGARPARAVMPAARAAAARALSLDGAHCDALAMLGTIALGFDYDDGEAERVWSLVGWRPESYAAVWFGIEYLYSRQGPAAAIPLLEEALRFDPLNGLFRSILAFTFVWAGLFERAVEEGRRCLYLDTLPGGGHFAMAMAYACMGRLDDAVTAAERAYHTMPSHPRFVGLFAGTLANTGDDAAAARLLDPLTSDSLPCGAPMGMIQYYLTTGEVEETLPWFERAIAEREPLAVIYACAPQMDALRATERWSALLSEMRLPIPDERVGPC